LRVGCTGWINSTGLLVTAGHCLDYTTLDVIQFNVPSSLSNGTIQHPGPEDQYYIDDNNKVYVNGGVGNDWGVFSVFNNSNTGLQPIEAQGTSFISVQELNSSDIRITGYGVDGPPPKFGNGGAQNSDNQTQQTDLGPNKGSSGTTLKYEVDTQPGNSGSPVIDEGTGNAIGVHTNGGCNTYGFNRGTSTFNTEFWEALSREVPVIVYQKLFSDSSVDSIAHWENNDFAKYKVPKGFIFTTGTNEVLRGAQKVIEYQKYQRWNQLTDVTNHHVFNIIPYMEDLTSNFDQLTWL
ncbi:MAG: trypsin-like serine peptidase, partial [Calditrichia bacterium]